ncbi:hypothetical protein PRUPE_5G038700 [Prunus persica]|uniref:Reticulon domain-containing protein n=1 Tax=Prunus persica TaxID=3760 RepID=M5WTU9_PRUPE|nr:hypothetical protein PRUPE_5G038700 [Prunus persica]
MVADVAYHFRDSMLSCRVKLCKFVNNDNKSFLQTAHQITSYLNLLRVVFCLYKLSALGRLVSGLTVAYAGLCLFCLYILAENSQCMFISISEENE